MHNRYPTLPVSFFRRILLPLACFFGFHQTGSACGYDWVSECSSQVQLRINGTLDSFLIAPCPSGFSFDGLNLGTLQSLNLANAKTITWESCQNNVSGMILHYRVYEQGFPGGAWLSLSLQEDYNKVEGAYTTRYRKLAQETVLTSALVVGKTYTLELYFEAQVDTIGDDFIPETSFYRNNNGQNYRMSFTYGGAAASPLLLLPHLTEPRCHNGNDGKISVSVYGNHNGIFYHWSNTPSNFFEQNFIPAGTYALTVTNAAGESASIDIQLGQPDALQIQFPTLIPASCNSPGMATALVSGGNGNYQYAWSNGAGGSTVSLPAGDYGLTVTDALQCSSTAALTIQQAGYYSLYFDTGVCLGDTFYFGNQAFTQAGSYEFWLPGNNACDTLVQIELQVQDPAAFFSTLPDTVLLTCANPVASICAVNLPESSFLWIFNDHAVSTQPCVNIQQAGVYMLYASVPSCLAQKNVVAVAYQTPPEPTLTSQPASGMNIPDGSAAVDTIAGNGPFVVQWDNQATTPAIQQLLPGEYCVTVTDAYGCSAADCITVEYLSPVRELAENFLNLYPNPATPGEFLTVQLPTIFQDKTVEISWQDPLGRPLAVQSMAPVSGDAVALQVPAGIRSRLAFVRLQANGHSLTGKVLLGHH